MANEPPEAISDRAVRPIAPTSGKISPIVAGGAWAIANRQVALGEDDSYEVAADEHTVRERLVNESDVPLAGTACRIVGLNVTMSVPRSCDNGDKTDKAVDVTIHDDAGRIVNI